MSVNCCGGKSPDYMCYVYTAVRGVTKTRTQLSNWTELNYVSYVYLCILNGALGNKFTKKRWGFALGSDCQNITDTAAVSNGLSFLSLAPADCTYVWGSDDNDRMAYGEEQHSRVWPDFWHWKIETWGPSAEKLGKGTKGRQRGAEFSVEHKYAFTCQGIAQRGCLWAVKNNGQKSQDSGKMWCHSHFEAIMQSSFFLWISWKPSPEVSHFQ